MDALDELDRAYEAESRPASAADGAAAVAVTTGDAAPAASEEKKKKKKRSSRDRSRSRSRDRSRRRDRSRSRDRDRRDRGRRDRDRDRSRRDDRDRDRRDRRSRSRDRDRDRRDRRSRSRDRGRRDRDRRRSRSKSRSRSPAVERSALDRDNCTVMVQQLPRGCVKRDLFKHFEEPCGKIVDIQMISDRYNPRQLKGIAYVEFDDVESVTKALALNGQKCVAAAEGRKAPLIITPTGLEKNREAALKEKRDKAGGPNRISIHNLPAKVNSDHLRSMFESFADADRSKINVCKILEDPTDSSSAGIGYIEFSTASCAQMAVSTMNNVEVGDKKIRVGLTSSEEILTGKPTGGGPPVPPAGMPPPGMGMPPMGPGGMMMPMPPRGPGGGLLPMPPGMMGGPPPGGMMMPPPGGGLSAGSHQAIAQNVAARNMFASAPIIPSKHLVLKNVFDPAVEVDKDWDLDVRDEILEEVANNGDVVHIFLDKESKGDVFLKFSDVESAHCTQIKMHARGYGMQTLHAEFVNDSAYVERFPDSANATTPLALDPLRPASP